jgi:hypothetical protein
VMWLDRSTLGKDGRTSPRMQPMGSARYGLGAGQILPFWYKLTLLTDEEGAPFSETPMRQPIYSGMSRKTKPRVGDHLKDKKYPSQ